MKNKKEKEVSFNKASLVNKLNKKSDFKIYELLLFGFLIILVSVLITLFLVKEINTGNSLKNKITLILAD